jgi:hypothetical protein
LKEWFQQDPEQRFESIRAIKEQLIGRQNESVRLQKLDQLKHTVVPETSIDDPIVKDPIRLVEVDYVGRSLHFILSQPPNPRWTFRFQNLGSYRFIVGKKPENFSFQGALAGIEASENEAQMLVDLFKEYVERTNKEYAAEVERNQRIETERQRQALRQAIAAEERRQRILKGLRF